ncbi:hypothetical protein NC652_015178 [Populus alba x Populus x berolinensis]|nr:hypothetical protein NC652_015178 [Populus alba x Populus x berolinensis]
MFSVLVLGSHKSRFQNMSLKGTLPQNLNQLTKLQRLGLQRNQLLTGALPSLSVLSELQSCFYWISISSLNSIPF